MVSSTRSAASRGARAASGIARTLNDPKKAKRLMAVGKVVAPMLAPVAVKSVDALRALADRQRAKRLGVPVDEVAGYRGPTGRTRARIDAVSAGLDGLTGRRGGDAEVRDFAERARATLTDLISATATAAPMPPARRRPVLAAVKRELDQLESELIGHLVRTGMSPVRTTGRPG